MKNTFKLFAFFILITFFGCQKEELLTAPENGSGTYSNAKVTTITAQSIQVNAEGIENSYQITGTETWSYDWSNKPDAVAAFDTYFELESTNLPMNDNQIETGKHQAFQNNKCNFWNGTPLLGGTWNAGGKYYTWKIKTSQPNPQPKNTGWTLVANSNATTINITLGNIFIASESYMNNGKNNKYSFTMGGGTEPSRLTGLTIELWKDGVLVDSRTPGHIVELSADWLYTSCASFGDPTAIAALKSGMWVSDILKLNIPKVTLTTGSRALVDPQEWTGLEIGNYEIKIKGVIKGNAIDGTSDKTFSVSKQMTTVGGCL